MTEGQYHMNTTNTFLRGMGTLVLLRAFLGLACLAPVAAMAQRDLGCSPTVANPCTGGSGGSTGSDDAARRAGAMLRCKLFGGAGCPDETSPAEQARQQRRSAAQAVNSEAIQFQNKGDWARAVTLFQEAANKDPSDPIIQQNLANAQRGLARVQEEQARLRAEAQEKASAERMSKSIQDLARSFSAAPAPVAGGSVGSGLDFDGRDAVASPARGSAAGAGGGLDFTAVVATAAPVHDDPRVVDARNVRSGLSPAVDTAIDGVFASAPPGVNDRVRKGFQAATVGDWKVAEAWFADALNRDPGNVALKNMLAAARSSTAPARTAQRGLPPRDEIADLYNKGYEAVASGDRAGALAALEAAIGRDPRPSGAAITYVAYLRASVAAAKGQVLQLPDDSDMLFLFPGSDSSTPVQGKTPAQGSARPNSNSPTTPFLKRLLDAMTGSEKAGSPKSKAVASVRG